VHTRRSYEDDGPLAYAANFWIEWNTRCEALTDRRLLIEDAATWWPKVAAELELSPASVIPRVGASSHDLIDWGDLGVLADPVRALAKTYGYLA